MRRRCVGVVATFILSSHITVCARLSTSVAGSKSSVVVSAKSSRHLLPQQPRTGFSVECWACVTAGAGVPRVVFSSGRFELGVGRLDRWRFTLFVQFPDKPIVGTRIGRCWGNACVAAASNSC